jgi:hypothetical protein
MMGLSIGATVSAVIWGGFFLLVAVGLLILFTRMLLSAVALGPWACGKNWHWWRDFKLHDHYRVIQHVQTYLAVGGVKIEQCRTCGLFKPEGGGAVYNHWKSGDIRVVGGGPFWGPKIKIDPPKGRTRERPK